MQITYENKDWDMVTIDAATANIDQVMEAYAYLLDRGYTGAFPGSREWQSAQPFVKQLADLVAARPEVEQSLKLRADAKAAERLTGKDILSL